MQLCIKYANQANTVIRGPHPRHQEDRPMAEQQGAGVVETPGSTSTQQPAAAAGTAAGTGNAAPTATPTGTPNPTPFSYKEDRSNWIPDHRFKEVSAQARRATELESQLNEERRRVAALAGVNTPTADSQKSEQIKAAFFEMFPQMKALANLTPEQIQQAFTTMPDAVNSAQQGATGRIMGSSRSPLSVNVSQRR